MQNSFGSYILVNNFFGLQRCVAVKGEKEVSRPYSQKANTPGEVRVYLPGVPLVEGLQVQEFLPKHGLLNAQVSKIKFALFNLENVILSGNWERFFSIASNCQALFSRIFSYQDAMTRSDYEEAFDPIMMAYSSYSENLRFSLDDAFLYLKNRVNQLTKFSIEERKTEATHVLGILTIDALTLFKAFGGDSKKRYSPITIQDISKLEAVARAAFKSEDEPAPRQLSIDRRTRSFSSTSFRPISE